MSFRKPSRFFAKRIRLEIGLVVLLSAILVLLGVLQYRWIGEIGKAERTRLQSSLRVAIQQFRLDFTRELHRLCAAFDLRPALIEKREWNAFAESYEAWLWENPESKLIANLFLWTRGTPAGSQFLRLNPTSGQWEPAAWPDKLQALEKGLARAQPGEIRRPPGIRVSFWWLMQEIPVLIHPVVLPEPTGENAPARAEIAAYLIVELDPGYLRRELLPGLVQRHFGNRDVSAYDVAIISGPGHRTILYQSDSSLAAEAFTSLDARARVLWDRPDLGPPPPEPAPPDAMSDPSVAAPPPRTRPHLQENLGLGFQGRMRRPLILLSGWGGSDWEIVARHREGSLQNAVVRSQLRQMTLSFGILLLLALSLAMLLLATRRARRLARLQMEFVAAVSHDLRTPLAVICSAGDNLAEGVVGDNDPRVKQYGQLVRDQGRQLSGMVEQILEYASLQSGRKKYDLQPVAVAEIVDSALADRQHLITSQGFTIEKSIKPDLPPILADRKCLSQVLGNLINNALKYCGEGRWIGISAAAVTSRAQQEVQITVEDRGAGIDAVDLPHIFDPFYRGRNAVAGGIAGTGLGLSIARECITAMGGLISAKTLPGKGSSFTVHLPTQSRKNATATSGKGPG